MAELPHSLDRRPVPGGARSARRSARRAAEPADSSALTQDDDTPGAPVMSSIVSANTNATTPAIAERAAALISEC
jgi:hypothetical protein